MPCCAMLRHEARDANDEQREQRLSSVLCSSGGEDHMIMEDPNISPDGPDGHLDIQNGPNWPLKHRAKHRVKP